MCIYVEGHEILTTNLNVKILKAISTEDTEDTLLRVLVVSLDDKLL